MKLSIASTALILLTVVPLMAQRASVPRFTPHEVTSTATGSYANPYVDLIAEATLTEPDGRTKRTVPLFWDGGTTWKLRFAPDKIGIWKWTVSSTDRGLNQRAGIFECVASERRGSIQPMAGAPRHFQYQNGEPMWFMGDTAWAYVTDSAEEKHDRAAAERYLSLRARQGFNAIHVMLLSEAGWHNRNGPPWTDMGNEKINPAYFREADERIAFANAQGIVTGIALAWADKRRNEAYSWKRLPNLPARLRYARYVAARYGAYDAYFLVAGEWVLEARSRGVSDAALRDEFVQIGDAFRAADPHRRMLGIHPTMHVQGSTREFNSASTWMDFADYQQNYLQLHGRALASRVVAKPVVNSEYGYLFRDRDGDGKVDKSHSYTVDSMRHATWDIVMTGAYVVTGFGSTYMGGERDPGPFRPDDPGAMPWVEQIGRSKQFFVEQEYWKLEPHDELVTSELPRTEDRAEKTTPGDPLAHAATRTYWCLAAPDRRIHIVYVRGMTQSVELAAKNDGKWTVALFDPRTGARENVAPKFTSRSLLLSTPDDQDWIFVVRSQQR